MTNAWNVFSATLFGVLVFAVQKLGATVVIFAYLYSVEHVGVKTTTILGWTVQVNHLLVATITLLSVLLISFKSMMLSTSRRLDSRCIHVFDSFILHHVHNWDLTLTSIRAKALSAQSTLKALSMFVMLAIVASINSFVFPGIILIVLLVTAVLAYNVTSPAFFESWPHVKPIFEPENYSELFLIFGLLIGFLLVVPDRGSLLGSVIVVLLVARFSGQLRVFAKNVARLSKWRQAALAKHSAPGSDRFKPKA
jgi:hypothetical protein